MLFLAISAHVAYAEPYQYAPENCEFRATLPGEPYHSRRCDKDDPTVCREMTSYTKVFGMDATVNINLTCNPAETDMYARYDGDIMQATLTAMLGQSNRLEDFETGYQEFDVAKQAVLLGVGPEGNQEKIFVAQLWIGHKSVFSIEAELIGTPAGEADRMFSALLASLRHESWPAVAGGKDESAPAEEEDGGGEGEEEEAPSDN